ncbi:MAG TPA: sodium:solute symporter family protein [Thermoanaerobaculia bacterium]|nr:sodium:solute symporter family protein [Thermoanaerobaculia bacterium]
MNAITSAVLGYVVLQLLLGAYISRRVRTEEDYLLAGRSLGPGLVVFSIFATWFGAETCLGAAGAVYANGLSGGRGDPLGYALCILFLGFMFALPLWRMKLTTAADLYRRRYSRPVETLVVVITVPTSLLWAAAQIRAFGQVISAVSGIDPTVTITIAAVVVVVYTMLGGFLADVWTDVIQGITLTAGLLMLVFVVLRRHGAELVSSIDPERIRLLDPSVSPLVMIEALAIPILGSVMAPELIARVLAARSGQVARVAAISAGGVYFLVGLVPVALGLLGYVLIPGLEDPEQILPRLAEMHLSPVLYAIFAGAILSAILSTADSTLLVSSSLVVHNLLGPRLAHLGEHAKVTFHRAGVAVFGVVAYGLAFSAEGVYALVVEASAFGSAGIFVVGAIGLRSRIGAAPSALLSISLGAATWILGAYIVGWDYPYLVSLAAAALGYLLGLPFGRNEGRALHASVAG